jgi:hypothetical protein
MRIQTYRDESRCRHFDLVVIGEHARSIDLVWITTLGMLVMGFAGALIVPFSSTVVGLSQWVH